MCEGRPLKKASIRMYHILESDLEVECFNIILENVKITAVLPYLSPTAISGIHLETLKLRHETITWKYVEGNIIYRETWNDRATLQEILRAA